MKQKNNPYLQENHENKFLEFTLTSRNIGFFCEPTIQNSQEQHELENVVRNNSTFYSLVGPLVNVETELETMYYDTILVPDVRDIQYRVGDGGA